MHGAVVTTSISVVVVSPGFVLTRSVNGQHSQSMMPPYMFKLIKFKIQVKDCVICR